MSASEKNPIIQTSSPSVPSPSRKSRLPFLALIPIIALLAYTSTNFLAPSHSYHYFESGPKALSILEALELAKCPAQPAAINIGNNWNPLEDHTYASLAAERLSKAVQIQTVSYDDMIGISPNDPRFDGRHKLTEYIKNEFPKIFETLEFKTVNTHGLYFTWRGSNPALQPILLMAHTDTVPVAPPTLDQWTFPPFEGRISVNHTDSTPGVWIWGRGSSDCKNSLLGIYGAVEKLILEGFEPERTIIIANGFDEEIGGIQGAGSLSQEIQKDYGPNSIAFLVDEGFSGVSDQYGSTIASFGMAEKGSVNVGIKVETQGGHSSVPPTHTGIGILSLLLNQLEAHPFKPTLDPEAPYLKYLSCLSEHAPGIPSSLKKEIKDPKQWDKLAAKLAGSDRIINSFLATTQAIDLIKGGVKVNALPEIVQATVNYRISFTSSVSETTSHVAKILVPLAQKLNFTISAFADPSTNLTKSDNHITLEIPMEHSLEPAPITPSDTKAFELMAGTCKTVFGEDTLVSPTGMFANTDTRVMWNLTTNIYRVTPARITETLFQHTVDERISLAAHLNTTRFYYKLIRNSIGWDY